MVPQRFPKCSKIAGNMCQESMINFDRDFHQNSMRSLNQEIEDFDGFLFDFCWPVTHRLMESKR